MDEFEFCQPCEDVTKRHFCDVDGCDYKAKYKSWISRHKQEKHNIGVKWVYCEIEGCHYRCKKNNLLKMHKANKHGLAEKWIYCDIEECDYKTIYKSHIRIHELWNHENQIQWITCPIDNCDYKTRDKSVMTKHKAWVHDINVKWHFCDIEGCDYKTKTSSALKSHIKSKHTNIYNARRKIEEENVRNALLENGWIEMFSNELMPVDNHFIREKRIDFRCINNDDTWCRIDFVLKVSTGYVFLEVDEHQHRCGYDAELSCDMKRMAKVMGSLVVECSNNEINTPNIYWIRYNPNTWYINNKIQKTSRDEREKWLMNFISNMDITEGLTIGYAFYDTKDGKLQVLSNENFDPTFAECVVKLY